MSARIPVGEVLNEAFKFGLERWVTVLRYVWAPVVLIMLVAGGALYLIVDMPALQAMEGVEEFGSLSSIIRLSPAAAILTAVVAALLSMLIISGAMASVYRLVSLGEDHPGWIGVRFDGPAQRVFWAQILMAVISYAVMVGAVLLALAISGQSFASVIAAMQEFVALVQQATANPELQPDEETLERLAVPISAMFLGGLIAMPLIILLNIRLAPFLAGSAAENRLLFMGSFGLTRGVFWPLFGLYLLFLLALMVIGVVFSLASGVLELLGTLSGGLGVVFVLANVAASFVYQIYIMGVQLSLQGIVYRRLKTGQ